MLFSTRLRPSKRQCSFRSRLISCTLSSGKQSSRFFWTTRLRSLGISEARQPRPYPSETRAL
jgi:hypothetical protein